MATRKTLVAGLVLGALTLFSIGILSGSDLAADQGSRYSTPSGSVQIMIGETGFDPAVVTVTLGTEVVWYNSTSLTQTLQSGSPQRTYLPLVATESGDDGGAGRSSALKATRPHLADSETFTATLPPGGAFAYLFTTTGRHSCFLVNSPQFIGYVIVQEPPATPTPTGTPAPTQIPPPSLLEITQGIQQPDNSVPLIADRPTFGRLTLTSTTAYSNVSAWLSGYSTSDYQPLPGSPVAALNNPRTLAPTADRGNLDDTFNFELPSAWLTGEVQLRALASDESSTFSFSGGPATAQFIHADPLSVTIVPIAYTCTSGGSGTTTPAAPYDYLTDFTYRVYPVPSIETSTHAAIPYAGPCTAGGMPNPAGGDWGNMLDAVTTVWLGGGTPYSYYYGLVEIDCSGGCIAGIGWLGVYKAAVGFNGFGPEHIDASETHAHEVGHNHGRFHAPGCSAAGVDPSFPYVYDWKGYIVNNAHQNYGFDINDLTIYPYTAYYDVMSYCTPYWISDYTYEALLAHSQAHRIQGSHPASRGPALLLSGRIESDGSEITFRPAYVLDIPTRLPDPGDYTIELLDVSGGVIADYPFSPTVVLADSLIEAAGYESLEFHVTLPYAKEIAAVRVRRGDTILGTLRPGTQAPSLSAAPVAFNVDEAAARVNWSAADPDGDSVHYLVRASTDSGATWQVIGVNLANPSIELRAEDFGGREVLVQVFATDGLHTSSVILGPFAVPAGGEPLNR